MSRLPLASDQNTMRCPSGDHLGLRVLGPRNDVTGNPWDPSWLQTQISGHPDLIEEKAILLPSGENLGSISVRVDEMNLLACFSFAPEPGTSTRQIFSSNRWTSKANRLPWLEIAGWPTKSPASASCSGLEACDSWSL